MAQVVPVKVLNSGNLAGTLEVPRIDLLDTCFQALATRKHEAACRLQPTLDDTDGVFVERHRASPFGLCSLVCNPALHCARSTWDGISPNNSPSRMPVAIATIAASRIHGSRSARMNAAMTSASNERADRGGQHASPRMNHPTRLVDCQLSYRRAIATASPTAFMLRSSSGRMSNKKRLDEISCQPSTKA
jgi:hypothetical protein